MRIKPSNSKGERLKDIIRFIVADKRVPLVKKLKCIQDESTIHLDIGLINRVILV